MSIKFETSDRVTHFNQVRLRLSKGLGFSKEDRHEKYAESRRCADLVTRPGGVAITCAISPVREIRSAARTEICNKALRAEMKNFARILNPHDEPHDSQVIVQTNIEYHEESVKNIESLI